MRSMHAAALATLALLGGLPQLASAESYVRGSYAQDTLKNDDGNAIPDKQDGPRYGLDGRYDLGGTPFFTTLGLFEGKLENKDQSPPLGRLTATTTGYAGGLGYVLDADAMHEVYARLEYSHGRRKFDSDNFGSDCCATSDTGTAAVGLYQWVHPMVKLYGEAYFDRSSHHAHGYGARAGAEFAVVKDVRLFVEGAYGKSDAYDESFTGTSFGGGIKVPFGAAPAQAPSRKAAAEDANGFTPPPPDSAVATAPAAAPAAPAAVAAAGATAKLHDGVQLRAQPKADAMTLTTDAAQPVTLKATVTNPGGKWWLVSSAKGTGWVLESELAIQP